MDEDVMEALMRYHREVLRPELHALHLNIDIRSFRQEMCSGLERISHQLDGLLSKCHENNETLARIERTVQRIVDRDVT